MRPPTRRSVLQAAGTTAAAAAATAFAASAHADDGDADRLAKSDHTDQVLAYLPNPASGRVIIVRGEQRMVLDDTSLAARIARASGRT